jgi:O-antigen ligase/polysaccharide polymerase Wzy-like membrane protein
VNSTKAIAEKDGASFIEICLLLFIERGTAEKKRLLQIFLFLFIALCPIGDFILQGTPLRSLGMSPSIFPLFALALAGSAEWLLSAKTRVSRGALICFVYVLLTALYGFFVFGVSSHGENLFWKGTTSFISLAALLFATQLDYSNSSVVRTAIYAAFTLVVVGFLFGNSNPLGLPALMENGVLHFTPLTDERPRGLGNEANQLSTTAMIIGLLSVHVARSRAGKILLFLVTIGLLVASGSKGGILTLFICAMIFCIMKWHSKWYQVAGLLFVLFPLGLILIWLIPNLFPEESFAFSTTIPTRFSMIICALMTVAHHPFGVGMPGFLPAVATYLPDAMYALQSIIPIPLNFTEVSGYLVSADMVSTKTFFFDQLMHFGIPFALFFLVFITGLLKRLAAKRQTILLIGILACTIAIMTYHPGTGIFAIPILFGVALHEVRNGPDPLRCK